MLRFECHCHSHFSNIRLLDCINTPKAIIDRCIEIGLTGVCLTDHESLGGHVEMDKLRTYASNKSKGFKIGLGNEIYLTETRETNQKYYHFILIAKDFQGYKALRELSSIAWQNSYFDRGLERVPTLKSDIEYIINKYGKGHLIASSACLGSELDYHIVEMVKAEQVHNDEGKIEHYWQIVQLVEWCQKQFGNDYYMEVQPARSKDQLIVNNRISAIANHFNVKIIVTTDAHYLTKEDRWVHKAYLNSKNGEREVDEFYEYAYLQTEAEIDENLAGTGVNYSYLAANTMEIYDKIEEFSLACKQVVPEVEVKNYPKIPFQMPGRYNTLESMFNSDNPQERYWVNYCCEQLQNKGLYNDIYLTRLEEEARIKKIIGDKLETCVFSYPIFLQHYINKFWDIGSTVGAGRGSACAGLNHWLLGVTQLDPIKWELPFWRYMNEDRAELPDIDIDICPSKREEIFKSIREERGELGCVQVCTYGTETTRSAIATACRGYRSELCPDGIDNDIAQYMTSLAPSERGFVWPIHDLVHGNEEKDRKPVKKFLDEVNKYPGLLQIIEKIEGLINHRGIHASGVVFYNDDPYESACFMKATSGAITTQYSLHDAEYCGDTKYDFLVTEIQDVIVQCLTMLQEHGEVEKDYSLRQLYDKYIHPDVLPLEDNKMWDALSSGNILKLFQFDSQVGGQTVRILKPKTPREMANCNSVMRLMASEKGGETPTDRYKRMMNNMGRWYEELRQWHITQDQTNVLEKYYLSTYATPGQQEDMMMILMDEQICNFSLKEANDARKICAKKQMNRIEELHEKILTKASSRNLGEYVWETAVKPQMGYSFSLIHSLAYSFVGLQTIYLATYFNPVYWNTACLRVDAGLEEDASTNYGKIAKAVGNIIYRGIDVSLIDINKSEYMFEPDIENESILYGFKALNGIGGDFIQEIESHRPYTSFEDFKSKVKTNKTQMFSLIKSGAFDKFGSRKVIMEKYIWGECEPKKRITLQNFNGLNERDLIPEELSFEKRLFVFNQALKKYCKVDDVYVIKDNFYDFYQEFFDIDLLEPYGQVLAIKQETWKKMYTKGMSKAKDYFKEHQEELLNKLNSTLFQEMWEKYAAGSYADWEMDSLGFYFNEHPLTYVNRKSYEIYQYCNLGEKPGVAYTFKRNNLQIPIFETVRIVGTVIAKDDARSQISLLTPESGVVTVKFSRDYFARLNKRISEMGVDGHKHVVEQGWFQRGTKLMINGFRRDNMFMAKAYKKTESHQCYKITSVDDNGNIELEWQRADEK